MERNPGSGTKFRRRPCFYAASVATASGATSTGSTIDGSSFSGLFTRVEIGQMRMSSAGRE
jgi:hypothetical protein